MREIALALITAMVATGPAFADPEMEARAARPQAEAGARAGAQEQRTASSRLGQAVEMLRKGRSAAAAKVLEEISNAGPVPGVTDEALFRLALLSLKSAPGQGEKLLKRLRKEYPGSAWTEQAEPVAALLDQVDELRSQNRSLKGENQSLGGERDELKKKVGDLEGKVQQLNRNLDQLKHLDLELEQRAR